MKISHKFVEFNVEVFVNGRYSHNAFIFSKDIPADSMDAFLNGMVVHINSTHGVKLI